MEQQTGHQAEVARGLGTQAAAVNRLARLRPPKELCSSSEF